MLLWITIALFGIGILLMNIRVCENIGLSMTVIFGVALFAMACFMICNYIPADADIAQRRQVYESLTMQYENGLYDESPNVGRFQLLNRIEEWNADLAKMQTLTHDYWIGIFLPDYYDNFKLITINQFQNTAA